VFRNFPLASRTRMRTRAEMAEAAGQQGTFWPMHDLLFEHQDALEDEDLIGYAPRSASTRVGGGGAGQGLFRERVHEDFASGVKSA